MQNQQHVKNNSKNESDLHASQIKLPLLISVPHGGYSLPIELQSRMVLELQDIFPDSDPYTRQIYALEDETYYYHDTDIARAVIDLNREMDDLPPANPDGVVKSHTVMGKEVYREGMQPNNELILHLLRNYYFPYHQKIAEYMKDTSLLCGFDCHSMLEFLPGAEPAQENARPFICLSNCGNEYGDGDDDELTCPPVLIQLLADCLRSEFPDEAENIVLNTPFKGGHISRFHSKEIPWIQIELNRSAYLKRPWFNPSTLKVEKARLDYLRNKFLKAFITFCDEAGSMQYMHFSNLQRANQNQSFPFYT